MSLPEVESSARDMMQQARLGFEPKSRARGWLARIGLKRPPAPISPEPVSVGGEAPPRRPMSGYMLSFVAMVVLPAIAATLYFTLIASDQYISETRFAVHSMAPDIVTPTSKSGKATTANSFMGGLTAANDDSYMVAAYIRSRACVEEVSRTVNLVEMFRRPEADAWSRLKANPTPEELTKYWDYMVSSYVDPPSGIVTVSVAAFRREDALAIARAILKASEKVANDISVRAREDVMTLAQKELASAEDRVMASLADLRAFREKAGFIDPKLQSESIGRLLEELLAQRIRLQTEYEVSSRAMSPEAPTLQSLKGRLDQLDLQIADERAKLTSHSKDPKALANLLPKYEELLMRGAFASKLYGLAADGLERARLRAEAQAIYINVFVPPALPQEALFPERFVSSVLIALTLLVIWGIVALVAALVEDHKL
jgi:capsular polysaccharide transport system permease protein